MFKSSKTFGHNLGLSCCFRQHKAQSHCRLLHGYALEIRVEFQAEELDARNWVVDFGSLKSFKGRLEDTFDHKLLVAEDDPELDFLCSLAGMGLAEVVVVEATGCERFAKLIYEFAQLWLQDNGYSGRCKVASVEVREHAGNSAIYSE